MGCVEVEFDEELLVELLVELPLEAGAFEARVTVTGKAAVKEAVWLFESRETPTENEVETETGADVVALVVLLFCQVGRGGTVGSKGESGWAYLCENAGESEWDKKE